MSELKFSGSIVRVEPDGFGVVLFDHPIGEQANTHGIFSTTISSSNLPYRQLKPGVTVQGVAEVSKKNVASVKALWIAA
jgi:hypothetical protein